MKIKNVQQPGLGDMTYKLLILNDLKGKKSVAVKFGKRFGHLRCRLRTTHLCGNI